MNRAWDRTPGGMTVGQRIEVVRGTVLELGRVALAKLGHDPYGMGFRTRPWREAIPGTYFSHREVVLRRDAGTLGRRDGQAMQR